MPSPILTAGKGTTLLQKFAIRFLGLLGWTVAFAPLPGPRGVVIVYPHTSNWDFMFGLVAKWAMGNQPFQWLGKASLFRYGLGPVLRAVGGAPVVRGAGGAISRFAQTICEAEQMWLVLAPEGTRKFQPQWRSGFYQIALAAKVPVGIALIDYRTCQVRLVDYLELTGDLAIDTAAINEKYIGVGAFNPSQAAPVIFGTAAKPAEKPADNAASPPAK